MSIEAGKVEKKMGGSIDELLEWAENDIKFADGIGRMFSEIGKAAEIGVLVKKLVEIAKDKSPEMREYGGYKESVGKCIDYLRTMMNDFRSGNPSIKETATGKLDVWLTQVRDIITTYKKIKMMETR